MSDEHHEHPGRRGWEPDDPMRLHATQVPGEVGVMLDCLIEEYARLGWGAAEIERLFAQPFFQATYDLGQRLGSEAIHERIRNVLRRCGVSHATVRPTRAAPDTSPDPTPLDVIG